MAEPDATPAEDSSVPEADAAEPVADAVADAKPSFWLWAIVLLVAASAGAVERCSGGFYVYQHIRGACESF